MAKNNRPIIDNPLASMGLDQIVRNITAPETSVESDKKMWRKTPMHLKRSPDPGGAT